MNESNRTGLNIANNSIDIPSASKNVSLE